MIVYGKQVFWYIAEKHPNIIKEVLLSKDIDKKSFNKIVKLNKKIIKLDNKKAQSLAKGGNHQGYFLDVEDFTLTPLNKIKKLDKLILLDGVSDVGNIGSIVRTAYALGFDGIIATNVKQLQTESIIRSSSGAMIDLPFSIVPNCGDLVNELIHEKFTLIGASLGGTNAKDLEYKNKKVVLCLGSEGAGLSKKISNKLHEKVKIEMKRDFDSLNVSVAGAILIHLCS
jgi:23S rRNA (guanosine2251-2'-O)-methyltransferase